MVDKKRTFFLRFYEQTDGKVAECIDQMKAAEPRIAGHSFDSRGVSMNIGMSPTHCVYLHFQSEADRDSAYRNPEIQRLYRKYASGGKQKGSVVQRKPGQVAFR